MKSKHISNCDRVNRTSFTLYSYRKCQEDRDSIRHLELDRTENWKRTKRFLTEIIFTMLWSILKTNHCWSTNDSIQVKMLWGWTETKSSIYVSFHQQNFEVQMFLDDPKICSSVTAVRFDVLFDDEDEKTSTKFLMYSMQVVQFAFVRSIRLVEQKQKCFNRFYS